MHIPVALMMVLLSLNLFPALNQMVPSQKIPTLAELCLTVLDNNNRHIVHVVSFLKDLHTQKPLTIETMTERINSYLLQHPEEKHTVSFDGTQEALVSLGSRLAVLKKDTCGKEQSLIIHEKCTVPAKSQFSLSFISKSHVALYEYSKSVLHIWNTEKDTSNLYTIPLICCKQASLGVIFFSGYFITLFPKAIIFFNNKNLKRTTYTTLCSEKEKILTARKSSNNTFVVLTTHGVRLYDSNVLPLLKQKSLISFVPDTKKLVTDMKCQQTEKNLKEVKERDALHTD